MINDENTKYVGTYVFTPVFKAAPLPSQILA